MIATQQTLCERLALDADAVQAALSARCCANATLGALAAEDALFLLYRAQDYSLLAPGKRIRPALVLEVCAALDGDRESALPLACAIEMIHTYSLIHDDLPSMDNDELRRGRPTSHVVFGEATAILAGDSLLTDAFSIVADARHLCDTAVRQAVSVLAQAAGSCGMVGGQMMDLEGETRRLSEQELLLLHSRKTGALIRASVRLGAIATGCADESALAALDEYARNIGLAFQIVDDILDVTADPTHLGKSCGKDAAENKTTFLTYYTVEQARAYAEQLTDKACKAIAPWDREGILQALAHMLAGRDR